MNVCAAIGKLGIVVLLSEEEDSFFITNCHCMILLFPLQLILQSIHPTNGLMLQQNVCSVVTEDVHSYIGMNL
jgi:hypothetical protein